ncbi:MAG TPA: GNAT family N-acetyltransferase [Myxococcaceae bacterium]|nr:GNAT family N-acetyltransferase [Myxococcaceae bacterium]
MLRESDAVAGQTPAESLRVELISDLRAFASMRAEWSALLEESDAAIFNGWDWLYPWYRRIAPSFDPWVLAARDGAGRLCGILPLAREERRLGPARVRRLRILGDQRVGSDYLDVVAAPARRGEVTRAFARELLARRAEWDVLDLNDLDERSPTPAVLLDLFDGSGWEVRTFECSVCPNETFLDGETFDQFLRRTRRRDNYLRRRKWFEKQEGYRLEISTDPAALTRPLAEFFRLHALRWAEDGGSSGITGSRVEAFHRDATHLLAQAGKLRLYTLWVGQVAVASVYGIVHRDTFLYYQSGMDPEWRSKSAGMVVVGATFEDAIQSGLRHYDFLRGTEAYKSDWVSKLRRTIGLRLVSRQGVGPWWARADDGRRAGKNWVKRALPEHVVERMKRLRRQLAQAA